MSNDKHTQAFRNIMYGKKEPSLVEANNFVMRLSESLTDEVVGRIVANTGKTRVTNSEIYEYCQENGIKPDYDPYLGKQETIDFTETVCYSSYKAMDDITIDGKTGFVLINDCENKKITIEFDDDTLKTISYE